MRHSGRPHRARCASSRALLLRIRSAAAEGRLEPARSQLTPRVLQVACLSAALAHRGCPTALEQSVGGQSARRDGHSPAGGLGAPPKMPVMRRMKVDLPQPAARGVSVSGALGPPGTAGRYSRCTVEPLPGAAHSPESAARPMTTVLSAALTTMTRLPALKACSQGGRVSTVRHDKSTRPGGAPQRPGGGPGMARTLAKAGLAPALRVSSHRQRSFVGPRRVQHDALVAVARSRSR